LEKAIVDLHRASERIETHDIEAFNEIHSALFFLRMLRGDVEN